MTKQEGFEIHIGVVGGVEGAGKHTVVDAILSTNFREQVQEPRTPDQDVVTHYKVQVESNKENDDALQVPKLLSDELITIDEETEIQELTFLVTVDEEVVPMRSDTQLVFTVFPTQQEEYLAQQWNTLDVLIIVTDGKKGMYDTDTSLWKAVRDLQTEKHEIPMMVLCNKVDENDDEKLARHLKKAKSKFEKVFETEENDEKKHFVFCSVCALHAFIYRAGAQMSAEKFEAFDQDLKDVVGKHHFGSKKWKKMSDEDRVIETHGIVNHPTRYLEAMKDCGFDQVMIHLVEFVGGEETQLNIIRKQLKRELDVLSPFDSEWISYRIFNSYQKHKKLLTGEETDEELAEQEQVYRDAFWKTFEQYVDGNFDKFKTAFPLRVSLVADVLQELMYYKRFVAKTKWEGEEEKVMDAAKALVSRYLRFLILYEKETSGNTAWTPERNVSPIDWDIVWKSVLLLSYNSVFCEMFGKEKMLIEGLASNQNEWANGGFCGHDQYCVYCAGAVDETKTGDPRCKTCNVVYMEHGKLGPKLECLYCGNGKIGDTFRCENCRYLHQEFPDFGSWIKFSYNDELEIVPDDPENYKKLVHLQLLSDLNDPNHFGHLIFKFCEVQKENTKTKAASESESKSK